MNKSRDRLFAAAVALLKANGHTGHIRGSLTFYEVADTVIEEILERVEERRETPVQVRDLTRKLREAAAWERYASVKQIPQLLGEAAKMLESRKGRQ